MSDNKYNLGMALLLGLLIAGVSLVYMAVASASVRHDTVQGSSPNLQPSVSDLQPAEATIQGNTEDSYGLQSAAGYTVLENATTLQ